jgi:hypothetical protein
MTKDEALKMAIEALEESKVHLGSTKHLNDLIQACKDALEQPPQEIVRKVFDIDNFHSSVLDKIKFTSPHQWQGLTDKEIFNLCRECDLNHILGIIDCGRAIEQALKDKNNAM